MRWYDVFASFYDASLESLYASARIRASEALRLRPGELVVDIPCGTGLSFDALAASVTDSGQVLGLDRSRGMLARARRRAVRKGFEQVRVESCDVHAIDAERLANFTGRTNCDALHVFLGFTAFDEWEHAFARLFGLLRPGGRMVVADVHAAQLGVQGRLVNLLARADLRRAVWEPLEHAADDFSRETLPEDARYGGELFVARGTRPVAEL